MLRPPTLKGPAFKATPTHLRPRRPRGCPVPRAASWAGSARRALGVPAKSGRGDLADAPAAPSPGPAPALPVRSTGRTPAARLPTRPALPLFPRPPPPARPRSYSRRRGRGRGEAGRRRGSWASGSVPSAAPGDAPVPQAPPSPRALPGTAVTRSPGYSPKYLPGAFPACPDNATYESGFGVTRAPKT